MELLLQRIQSPYQRGTAILNKAQSLASIFARLYLAKVFFFAGLVKIQDWDTTLFLFEEEYSVPLLPYELAAYLGTAGELVLPILLVLGLATRFSALGLFVVNFVAVVSLEDIAVAAEYLHVLWGVLAVQLAIYGGGFFTLDNWLKRKALKH